MWRSERRMTCPPTFPAKAGRRRAVCRLEPLEGRALPSFLAPVNYDTARTALAAAGDFNGDGIPDLVAHGFAQAPGDGAVSLLVGNGDGSFRAPSLFPIGGG